MRELLLKDTLCRGLKMLRMSGGSSDSGQPPASKRRWQIHPERLVISRFPDGQLHKMGSGMPSSFIQILGCKIMTAVSSQSLLPPSDQPAACT